MKMVNPLDVQRMAVRIERLMHTSTHGWDGDELEFRNLLPTGRDPRHLPDPKELRTMTPTENQYRFWNGIILRMEGMIQDNDPRNPRKMMRDMARGKMPGRW